jgi:hypothetical protein
MTQFFFLSSVGGGDGDDDDKDFRNHGISEKVRFVAPK